MSYIALAVLCSLVVSILLKLASAFQWDVRQGIAGNYPVAAVLTWFLLSPRPEQFFQTAGWKAWLILVLLGVLLPGIFWILAKSVSSAGIARTDAAQRLSLLLPLLAAFLLFGEALTWQKGVAVALGLMAVASLVVRSQAKEKKAWIWPASIFLGMGMIDILFKEIARMTSLALADFLSLIFLLATLLSFVALVLLSKGGRLIFKSKNLLLALLLGGFNFGNIYFFVRAHQALPDSPALVFLAMNIGVIVLATLLGLFAFKESLSRLNKAGMLLAVVSVVLLAGS